MPSSAGSLRRVLGSLGVLLFVAQALFVLSRIAVWAAVLAWRRLGIRVAGRRLGRALVVGCFLAEFVGPRRVVSRLVVHAGRLPRRGGGKR